MDFATIVAQNDNVKFVILRIGLGSRTGATPTIDPKFEECLNGCIENNIPVGVYFFSHATDTTMATTEANWVVEQLSNYPRTFEFPIYFDQEDASLNNIDNGDGTYSAYNPGKAVLTDCINTFCKIIDEAGYMPGVYTNPNWTSYYINFNDLLYTDHIWIAQYNNTLTWSLADVKIWQSGTTTLNGYTGDVDYNECYFNYPQYVRDNNKQGF